MTIKNMKYKTMLVICVLLFTTILCGGCGNKSADKETASQETTVSEKALMAYQEILKASPSIEGEHSELADPSFDYDQNQKIFGNHYDMFAIEDINNDDVPELIALSIVNSRWTPVSVYTYMDSEAVLLKDHLDMGAHGTFEQCSIANGAYINYICEENHIHNVWRRTNPIGEEVEDNYAYVIAGTTLTAIDCATGESGNTIYFLI